jgi:hypothetical protein
VSAWGVRCSTLTTINCSYIINYGAQPIFSMYCIICFVRRMHVPKFSTDAQSSSLQRGLRTYTGTLYTSFASALSELACVNFLGFCTESANFSLKRLILVRNCLQMTSLCRLNSICCLSYCSRTPSPERCPGATTCSCLRS